MQYGYFDDSHREYVINRPDTPLPWINYLGSEDYFGIISNTAGGYSFFQDARLRRLTRYRYNNVPSDFGGRYIYIRDNETSEFWSPSWQPTRKPLESYTCRHGLGYTIITSSFQGIQASTRYFVPPGQTLEIWQLTLKNHRQIAKQLSVFSCIEFCLWDAQDDATNFQRNFNIGEVEIEDGIIYHKTEYRERRNHFAYFACSDPIVGFDTSRDSFLGPYQGWDKPQVVENGQSNDSVAHGWAPIGSHHIKVNLEPGEVRSIIYILGYHENALSRKFDPPDSSYLNKTTVLPIIHRYLDPSKVESAFADLHLHWDGMLDTLQVQTPVTHANRMVNIWNPYQCMVTFNLARSASLFESGIGRGIGFRDTNQDLLGFLHMVPKRARQRILDIAATQLPSGGAYHQYQPLTKRGNNDIGTDFNDDPLWLILAVTAYLKETGDWSILTEPTPYDNIPGTETSLYEHLQHSIQYTLDRLGPHGLPLIGRADWNDCLNLNCFSDTPGQSFQATINKDGYVAESIVIAGLFVLCANELAACEKQLVTLHPDHAALYSSQAQAHTHSAENMASTILTHGWDGAWFLRAYDDLGQQIGSKLCQEGQIFIEPQGICIMAGVGIKDYHATTALESVNHHLATPHGILLQQPAYSQYYLNLGEISSYPPGYKENAGIFCHTNPWIMIAEACLGHGDRAFDYYMRINPSTREVISEIHRCEPYVYAQMIAGRDAPTFGEAKNSWLTGTAAWNYVAVSQYILGIHPTYQGLKIDPCIPSSWQGFTARRYFRQAWYNIEVKNPGHVSKGIKAMLVDGEELQGNIAPLFIDEGTHSILVIMG